MISTERGAVFRPLFLKGAVMVYQDIYKRALDLMFETDSSDYRTVAPGQLVILLQETVGANDTIRLAKGKEPLEAPVTLELTDEVEWEPELATAALAYGLAEKFAYDDDDMSKISYFHTLYVTAVNAASCAVPGDIIDVYDEEAEDE